MIFVRDKNKIVLVRRSKKLKADKDFFGWYGLGCGWLTCTSSGHLTGQPRKGDCSTVQRPEGRKSIYSNLQ